MQHQSSRRLIPNMEEGVQFKRGDAVLHPMRREWGQGVVDRATRITYDGQPAQRLVINFTHRGRVTINTAIAPLVPNGTNGTEFAMTRTGGPAYNTTTTTGGGWLGALADKDKSNADALTALPDALTDPFTPEAARLGATLDTYRFSTEPRSLIEWAIAQTGLDDPLSAYIRQELEQAFPRFARDRDRHLLDLVRSLKKMGRRDVLNEALHNTRHSQARNALKKAIRA